MEIQAVDFHRNGISGVGYFVVMFRDYLSAREEGMSDLLAIVPDEHHLDQEDREHADDWTLVLDPARPWLMWKGADRWGARIKAAVAEATADGTAFLHSYTNPAGESQVYPTPLDTPEADELYRSL